MSTGRDKIRELVDTILAELDRMDAAPKVLTDEEFDSVVNNWKLGERGVTISHRMCFADGLRYARDHYGIGAPAQGLTVDEWIEVVRQWVMRAGKVPESQFNTREWLEHSDTLSEMFTAALTTKSRTA